MSDKTKTKQTTLKPRTSEIQSYLRNRTFELVEDGVLTVSVYAHFFPVAFKVGKIYKGLDVDIMRMFANAAGLKIKFLDENTFNGIWNNPKNGKSDISIGGIGMVPSRLHKHTEWTLPYFRVMRTVVYNKKNPIKKFPQDVSGTVLGTYKSTGWMDAEIRMKSLGKNKFMKRGTKDEEDIKKLVQGKVQGLMRGSFVGQAIVDRHKGILEMCKPWEIEESLVTSDGEVFAYPTRLGSGVAVGVSSFLTCLLLTGELSKLLDLYHLL